MPETHDGRNAERSPFREGTLYVCATPIGNLEDLSPRALRLLRECDLIAAERPSHTRDLLRAFGVPPQKLRQCAESTPEGELRGMVRSLLDGATVALVTDAGTPGVSDPGSRLVALALAEGCRVLPVPGPSALTAALSVCGCDTRRVRVLGFLPRKPGERGRLLAELLDGDECVAFHESPARVRETLTELESLVPHRRLAALREATKVHEELLHGTASAVLERLGDPPQGEFTIVVEPRTRGEAAADSTRRDAALAGRIARLLELGCCERCAIQALTQIADIPRNRATRLVRGGHSEGVTHERD